MIDRLHESEHDGVSRRSLLATTAAVTTGTVGCLSVLDEECLDCGGKVNPVGFDIEYEDGRTLNTHGEPWASTNRDGVITVTHRSGDGAPASELTIEGSGLTTRGDGAWHRQADAEPGVGDSAVIPGSSTRVEADASFTLQVRWHSPDGDGMVLLAGRTRTTTESAE